MRQPMTQSIKLYQPSLVGGISGASTAMRFHPFTPGRTRRKNSSSLDSGSGGVKSVVTSHTTEVMITVKTRFLANWLGSESAKGLWNFSTMETTAAVAMEE